MTVGRVDETYIRVKGKWVYLYRAVDSTGATIDFLLSARRDTAAAKRFLAKALGGANHPHPRVINTDKDAAYPPAIVQLKAEGALEENCGHRPVQYLNNVLEQDHRAIKRRMRASQHFRKSRQGTMLLTKPVHDAFLDEIVGGYLKFNEIASGKADEPLPHLSRDVGEYEMFISKRDPKHSSGQHGDNLSFGFNRTLH